MAPMNVSLNAIHSVGRGTDHSDVYRGNVDGQWSGASAPHGGYISAMILTAAILHQRERVPSSEVVNITAHFLNRSEIGPIEFRIIPLRSGKTWSTIQVSSVQSDRVNVIAQVLFRTSELEPMPDQRSESPIDPRARNQPMTLQSGHSVLCPLITHPTLTHPLPFRRAFNFSSHVRWDEDLAIKHRQPMTRDSIGPIEWAAWHEFFDETVDVLSQPALLCYLCDMFKNFGQLIDSEETGERQSDYLWFPTLVYSVRFLTPLSSTTARRDLSRRKTGIYLTSRFNEPNGLHDDVVEVWTAPRDDSSPSDIGWRHNQRCLAVGTQLAATVFSREHKSRSKL